MSKQKPKHIINENHLCKNKIKFENLQQTHFLVALLVSGFISLQKSLIKSNQLPFMMKYHFDFLPTKSDLATTNNS